MKKCLIYLLIVLQIGGGFLGAWTTVSRIMRTTSTSNNVWVLNIPPILIFLFGIAAGLALVETRRLGLVLSAVYQTLQIPVLLSPLLCYKHYSGLLIGYAWSQGRAGPWMEFGSAFALQIFGFRGSWLVGIKLLALALFVLLMLELRRMNRRLSGQSETEDAEMRTMSPD